MNMKYQLQKEIYDSLVPELKQVEKIAYGLMKDELMKAGINVMQLPHRIKTWESVEGKMEKKADKYSSITDLTDLLGFRVICYFPSQVDEAATVIHRIFDVDEKNSVDKRMMLSPTAFGYISLHNICSLKKSPAYPDELTELKFEIQLRTILQHAWAEIEHDLGYKTALEIPRSVRREFSRVAGLLEVADNSFERIKDTLNKYDDETLHAIQNDTAYEMTLDIHTLNLYMKYSNSLQKFYYDMAELTGGKVLPVGAEGYLPMLNCLKIETLGNLHDLVLQEQYHALELLENALKYSDLEEITTNAALYYLCRARLIWGDLSEREIFNIYYMLSEDSAKAEKAAGTIIELREKMVKEK